MGEREHEYGPQPALHPVSEFLQNPQEVKSVIDTLQRSSDRYFSNRPTDEILAKKIMQVGREHIQNVLKEYDDPALPFPRYINSQQRADVIRSIAAITFGASYIVLRNFFATTTPNKNNEIIFDNHYLFNVFDKVTAGLPIRHTDAFSQYNPAPQRVQHMDQKTWRNLSHAGQDYGIGFLFHYSQGGKLPVAIHQLMHGLGVTSQVRDLAMQFGEILPKIESQNDTIARKSDFQFIKDRPQRRTSAQLQRDARIIDLLGPDFEKYFEPTPKLEIPQESQLEKPLTPNPTARWNDKDWFSGLFEK